MGRGARVDGEGFAGFPAGALATAVPSAFFTDILPQVESAEEMLVSVYFCFLQTLPANRRRPLSVAELRADGGLMRALGRLSALPAPEALDKGLSAAAERGLLLSVDHGYLLNTAANRRALATGRLAAAPESEPPPAPEAPPNIFRLYEDNIGPITPLLAEELAEAEQRFPGRWLEEAFREAVSLNKRSWRYIAAILERWAAEGPDYETAGRDPEADRLEQRYLAGRRRSSYGG
ncbi:MAG TPA: DnaD domain protein [Dehalococcoidia bacterium]|nr:DnaD domain protein [Dehalococcoidia bacterium]